MPKRKILFYGQVGRTKANRAIGGGELGNAKTVKMLSEDFEVLVVQRPYRIEVPIVSAPFYVLQLIGAVVEILFRLMSDRSIKAVHVSGFYFQQIYVEFLVLFVASLFKTKKIYELRAGGAIEAFNTGSRLYKYCFRNSLKLSDLILTQGKENEPFLKGLDANNIMYYPNYVTDDILNIELDLQHRNVSPVLKLVYFGRLNRAKNIELMVQTLKELVDLKVNVKLLLIGRIKIESFKEDLNNLIKELNLEEYIEYREPKYGIELWEDLTKCHFYLFPTENPREGHSNALTEAMALGIVPICSPNGFNKTVLGEELLIVDTFEAKEYSKVILDIWKSGKWLEFSESCRKRVVSHYTEEIVRIRLLNEYSDLLSAK